MSGSYSDMHPNKINVNDFRQGAVDGKNVVDKRLKYSFNDLDKTDKSLAHNFEISLACESGTDIVHAVGNVTAIAMRYILDQFPPNTFATALPSTTIAHRQLRHTPKQIRTQAYPLCVVSPRVSLSGLDNRLAAGSFATTTWGPISNRFQNRSEMEKLFFDKRKGIEWRGKINRVVLFLDFVLSFQSIAEQLRWASYLINKIPMENCFFDIDTALELALPDGFLEETAKYANIPIRDETGSVARFVDYLNMHSVFPVSYRFSSGRHRDAFYTYYASSILCSITDFAYNNATKTNNLVESDCPITFTMRCEFNTIGLFDLSVPNPGPFSCKAPTDNGVVIPIFSDSFNDKDFPLLYGWEITMKPIVQLDWGETEVDISSCLDSSMKHIIDYHLEHNMSTDLFISVKLRENRTIINDGYYVDWKNRKLIFTNAHYTHTYRMIIAVNKLYVNNWLLDMNGKT